jgi:nitrite reductase/ring-hydroxylating ferredoxin subunit
MRRRHFIKTFTSIAACSSLSGRAWTSLLAAEIRPQSTSTTGTLRLDLGQFPALQNESGSVRLAINPVNGNNGPLGQFYPVIINRGPNATFFALNSRCTHQSCIVEALDPSSNRMTCFCHGSEYGIDGKRLVGPAASSLTKYAVTFNGTNLLEVQIPNLGYSVTGTALQDGGNGAARFRLDFRASRNVEYEVRFQESLDKASTRIPFATTPGGAIQETSFQPAANTNASLYVERGSGTGFYTVAIRLTEI